MRGLHQLHTALATAGDWRADDRVMTRHMMNAVAQFTTNWRQRERHMDEQDARHGAIETMIALAICRFLDVNLDVEND
jgi:hypothetical protein